MNRYTITCTEEQTKKALELGAPIETSRNRFDEDVSPICQEGEEWLYAVIPTAEQMIGWLEEQENIKEVCVLLIGSWEYIISKGKGSKKPIYDDEFNSRKEATLAAIDAALEYLSKNK